MISPVEAPRFDPGEPSSPENPGEQWKVLVF